MRLLLGALLCSLSPHMATGQHTKVAGPLVLAKDRDSLHRNRTFTLPSIVVGVERYQYTTFSPATPATPPSSGSKRSAEEKEILSWIMLGSGLAVSVLMEAGG